MSEDTDLHARETDARLRRRAAAVIPGGMFGHMNAAGLPPGYPQFFAGADGCRLTDVDGNRYIDFMCSWGPMILGYRNPAVDAAVAAQLRQGDLMNGPAPCMVELAERLVTLVAHADWVLFQKNGTDATTLCVTIARARSGRNRVLVARGAYHGAAPWCTPSPAGITAADRMHLGHFEYNDIESLRAAFEAGKGDIAAVVVSAFKHDLAKDQCAPDPGFAQALRELCDAHGAALVLDEVRAGFRIDPRGSWESLGVRPDLSAWSKAVANGYPLAFVAGTDAFRDAARSVYATGSFWCAAGSMAAALATLDILASNDAIAHLRRVGERLRQGIARQALRHGLGLRQSGPAQMPMMLFDDDPRFEKAYEFTGQALRHGVYLHPKHNMFLSLAHTDADIDEALVATDAALAAVARRFG